MAIASHAPIVPSTSPLQTPAIEPESYKGIIVDTLVTPARALTAYVEGAPWIVTYFSQVVGKHNDLREIDTSSPNVYQQYESIKDMEIRVTSDLSSNYDEEQATMTVSGTATIYGVIVPKKADYFIASGFRGRTAIFRVLSVERMTHNSESVYTVNYAMDGYQDTQPDIYNALFQKTIRTFVFNKDRLIHGVSPLVREETNDAILRTSIEHARISKYWVDTFYNIETSTFVLPGQPNRIYDHGLTTFIMRTLSASRIDKLNYVRQLTIDNDYFMSQNLLWGVLLSREVRDLQVVSRKVQLLNRNLFLKRIQNKGAAYSTINNYICPLDVDQTTIVGEYHTPIDGEFEASVMVHTTNRDGISSEVYVSNYTETTPAFSAPTIYPILHDDYYVFSANFYNDTATKSLLEIVVLDYLNKRAIKPSYITHLLNTFYQWPRLEQFYYGPILLLILLQFQVQE